MNVQLNVTITNPDLPVQTLVMTNNSDISGQGRYAGGGSCNLYNGPAPSKLLIGDIMVFAPGYAPYSYFAVTGNLLEFQNETLDITVTLTPSFKKPSRSQIINVKANLCNLRDSDDIPIFDIFIASLIRDGNYAKANEWINILKANGTHINIAISGDYDEYLGWATRYPISGFDFTNDIPAFSSILDYVIQRGLIPIIKLATDGLQYDPAGKTYGWQWGMDNLPIILPKLDKYIPLGMFSTGFDGCFPTWSPEQTIQMLRMLRNVLGPTACIDTEFSGPASESMCYIHLGQGAANWVPDQLGILDNFSLEVLSYPPSDGGIAQTATRLLGPRALNCPQTPWYLEQMSAIKDINMCFYENGAYQAIRKIITPAQSNSLQDSAKYYGYKSFGNGQPA